MYKLYRFYHLCFIPNYQNTKLIKPFSLITNFLYKNRIYVSHNQYNSLTNNKFTDIFVTHNYVNVLVSICVSYNKYYVCVNYYAIFSWLVSFFVFFVGYWIIFLKIIHTFFCFLFILEAVNEHFMTVNYLTDFVFVITRMIIVQS